MENMTQWEKRQWMKATKMVMTELKHGNWWWTSKELGTEQLIRQSKIEDKK